MAKTTDLVALDEWYAIAALTEVGEEPTRTRLLGQDIMYRRQADGEPAVWELGAGAPPPIRQRYECLWTSLGAPRREIFDLEQAEESDRRVVVCGWVRMRTSGLRLVENFLDMAHFPYIHTNVLGAEPHTEVPRYGSEIRRDVDEVWATNCQFYQPQIVANGPGGMVQLSYRVPSPFVVMLYRVSPSSPNRLDAIMMFVQPIEEDLCRAIPVMYLVDDRLPQVDLLRFEQVIFLQDRLIVENQRPLLLPLEPRGEIPTLRRSLLGRVSPLAQGKGTSLRHRRRWLAETRRRRMNDVLLAADFVLTMDAANRVVNDGAVLVRGDRIGAVGRLADLQRDHPHAALRKLPDRLLMPGLINVHCHSGMLRGTAEGLPVWEWLTQYINPMHRVLRAPEAEAAAWLCYAEAVLSGTTTVVDMWRFMHGSARAAQAIGNRLVAVPYVGAHPDYDYFDSIDDNERMLEI